MLTLTSNTHNFKTLEELHDFVYEITGLLGNNKNYTLLLQINSNKLNVHVEVQQISKFMFNDLFSKN